MGFTNIATTAEGHQLAARLRAAFG